MTMLACLARWLSDHCNSGIFQKPTVCQKGADQGPRLALTSAPGLYRPLRGQAIARVKFDLYKHLIYDLKSTLMPSGRIWAHHSYHQVKGVGPNVNCCHCDFAVACQLLSGNIRRCAAVAGLQMGCRHCCFIQYNARPSSGIIIGCDCS